MKRFEVITETDEETNWRAGYAAEAKRENDMPSAPIGVIVSQFNRGPRGGHSSVLRGMTPRTARLLAAVLLQAADAAEETE